MNCLVLTLQWKSGITIAKWCFITKLLVMTSIICQIVCFNYNLALPICYNVSIEDLFLCVFFYTGWEKNNWTVDVNSHKYKPTLIYHKNRELNEDMASYSFFLNPQLKGLSSLEPPQHYFQHSSWNLNIMLYRRWLSRPLSSQPTY